MTDCNGFTNYQTWYYKLCILDQDIKLRILLLDKCKEFFNQSKEPQAKLTRLARQLEFTLDKLEVWLKTRAEKHVVELDGFLRHSIGISKDMIPIEMEIHLKNMTVGINAIDFRQVARAIICRMASESQDLKFNSEVLEIINKL